MIEVLEPEDMLLRQFVDSIYVFCKGPGPLEFTAYPGPNTPVGLFRNARLNIEPGRIRIDPSDSPNYLAVACNLFTESIHLQYRHLVDEIAINFKPPGFRCFSHLVLAGSMITRIDSWNPLLPALFDDVFATENASQRLYAIEKFLLAQYQPLPDESILLRALPLLNDIGNDYKMAEIAGLLGLHYKRLYRLFSENVGFSMAHYRNLVKFRAAVFSKMNHGDGARLVDISYENGYTDQAYFIRQFRAFTGKKPGHFFRDAVSFGKNKIVFRMD